MLRVVKIGLAQVVNFRLSFRQGNIGWLVEHHDGTWWLDVPTGRPQVIELGRGYLVQCKI